MDGSNAIFDSEGVAARNARVATHSSFDMLKSRQSMFPPLPKNLQFFCEWLYAKHSIHYTGNIALYDYLQLFAIYDHHDCEWAGWNEVQDWAERLHILTVPKLSRHASGGYPGIPLRFSSAKVLEQTAAACGKYAIECGHEGIVVRSMYSFPWNEFGENVAKYVRKDHVTTDTHWSHQKLVRNELNGLW
jgi:hypothetical protein